MGKKIQCSVASVDFILVDEVDSENDVRIAIESVYEEVGSVFLSPQKAIQLIKDIKQAYADAGIALEGEA